MSCLEVEPVRCPFCDAGPGRQEPQYDGGVATGRFRCEVCRCVYPPVEQVGWVRFDGDEYHDFLYWSPEDRHRPSSVFEGYLRVYARATEGDGS